MMSLASKATAFQTAPKEPFAMIASRRSLRDASTENTRHYFTRTPSTTTSLNYRDGSDDSSTARPMVITSRWWSSIFSPKSDVVDEQSDVDEYLEFLDRRYNRLHHEEEEEKPFSAINWLLQGKEGDGIASQQQKEDALHVLGLAGLASQKLLQKHPQLIENRELNSDSSTLPIASAPIDALDAFATIDGEATFGHMVIKKMVVPFVKFLYYVHRRRMLFAMNARRLATKAARFTARTILYGPATVSKLLMDAGGGKRNIVNTLAIATTMLILVRPVIQAMVTEGSVSP
jgi:hypothetical protein